jgi:pantothenate kinase
MWRAHSRPRGESISDIGACFGVDIGGTLSKLVFFAPDDSPDLDSVLGMASHSSSDSSPMSNSNEEGARGATGGAEGCVGGGEIGFWKTQIARITELCVSAASEDRRSSDWRGVPLPDQRSTEGGEDGEDGGGGGPADAMASFHSEDHRGTFHFVSVETRRLQEVCRYIKDTGLNQGLREMYVAGGGGHKYRQLFADELEITLVPVDELKTMIVALTFLISQDPHEIYTLEEAASASGGRGLGGGDGGAEGGVPGPVSGGGRGGGGVGCTGGDEDLVRRHTGPACLERATTEDSGGGVGGGVGGGAGRGKDEGNGGGNLGDVGSKRAVAIEGKGETGENEARGGAHIDALQIDIPSAPQESAQGGRESGSAGHFRSVRRPLGLRGALFPFVLCNIGSGVSILHVESVDKFTRISGSALGGATFWGLTRVMVAQPLASFSEALDLAEQGEAAAVNMCVRDIYGGAYKKHGLDENLTASFFGKVTGDVRAKNAKTFSPPSPAMASRGGHGVGGEDTVNGQSVQEGAQGGVGSNKHFSVPEPSTNDVEGEVAGREGAGRGGAGRGAGGGTSGTERPRDEDICRALLLMVSQNITQIAFLNARLVGVQRILFTGNFLRHNNIAMQVLTQSLQRWSDLSGVPIRALFVAHEGFLGALGAYLNNYL